MMVYFALLLAGIASGFLAGLLGIGGGFVMVPVLILLLPTLGIDPGLVPKVAVATSLAAMVPTACSAVLAQYQRGTLDLSWVRRLAPAAAIGAAIGSQLAAAVSGRWIAIVFAIYAGSIALKMLRSPAAAPNAAGRVARVIGALPVPGVGALIGAFSSIAGVGGASLTVPFLLSARVGFATASADTVSATSSALVGLIHWPAALMIAVSATLFAPRGVSVAHMLPVMQLKRAFAAVLVGACAMTLLKTANTTDVVGYAAVSTAATNVGRY